MTTSVRRMSGAPFGLACAMSMTAYVETADGSTD